ADVAAVTFMCRNGVQTAAGVLRATWEQSSIHLEMKAPLLSMPTIRPCILRLMAIPDTEATTCTCQKNFRGDYGRRPKTLVTRSTPSKTRAAWSLQPMD